MAPHLDVDLNQDKVITPEELAQAGELSKLNQSEEKSSTQRYMAWTAMVSMILFTGLLFTPFFSLERIQALSDVLDVFYIAQAGIIGAYFGLSGWLSRKNQ
jgi:hypothetical protein